LGDCGVVLWVMSEVASVVVRVVQQGWAVLGEMAAWVLGGFLIAGVLSLWLNERVVRRHFGGGRLGAILKAVGLGVPLPVCSCGVIPLAASLRRHGAGRGATAAFLMSTPQTGVDSIALTYGMMGGLFAVVRPLAALVSGVVAGFAVEGLGVDPPVVEGGNHGGNGGVEGRRHWLARVLHHGFVVLPRSVGGALLVGAGVSAIVMTLAPGDFIAQKISCPLAQMLLTLAAGIPMYICSTAAVPFVMGLMAAGLSPGAAIVFLIAGPGVSASTMLAVNRILGVRSTLVFGVVLAACALAFGFAVQALAPAGWLPVGLQQASAHAHHGASMGWSLHLRAALLAGVIVWAKYGAGRVGGLAACKGGGSVG
jgi:uncharacterized membrane protein YraQ (UPF0718 family)